MIPAKTLSLKQIRGWIPKRAPNSHKGDYGHVLIIAGSRGMSGASVLCALGALRGGCGLLTVAVPKSLQAVVAKKIRPEAMTLSLPETKNGAVDKMAVKTVLDFIEKRKISSLAMGPGLSRDPHTKKFINELLENLNRKPHSIAGIVLDADGFIALKSEGKKPSLFTKPHLPFIVTPHSAEMANFLNISSSKIEENRIQSAQKFAKLYRVIVVLKGHKTVITDGEKICINPTGNPGMAAGGSGDVLTGLIAALIAQTPSLLEAACAGVFVHGLAGDLAKFEKTEISLLAGDIAEQIQAAFKKILKR